jgi:hypothetical protein
LSILFCRLFRYTGTNLEIWKPYEQKICQRSSL